MRAERAEHLVVLRAHRLHPALLEALAELAGATSAMVWLVWHDTDWPAPRLGKVWSWPRAVDAIRSAAPPAAGFALGDPAAGRQYAHHRLAALTSAGAPTP